MISLRAIQLLLHHFDSIDQVVSRKLMRKRPWHEVALTNIFCDLLDEDAQEEEKIEYPLSSLMADLEKIDEPLYVSTAIETHQYKDSVERYVTQSDIGLIINYKNQFDPDISFSRSWLFQAKKLFPYQDNPTVYDENCLFNSFDKGQHSRIEIINNWADCEFIRYLLYCPRISYLQKEVREILSYKRTLSLTPEIFDFALGLQLRDDLLSERPTVNAGIFVATASELPCKFEKIYRNMFRGFTPFSWFILQHFIPQAGKEHWDFDSLNNNNTRLERLVRGDYTVLEESGMIDIVAGRNNFRFLPAHTIAIELICGRDRPRPE